jgi:hypothetical protein
MLNFLILLLSYVKKNDEVDFLAIANKRLQNDPREGNSALVVANDYGLTRLSLSQLESLLTRNGNLEKLVNNDLGDYMIGYSSRE